MRLKTTLAMGAAALAASAFLASPTTASAADDRANVSSFLAEQLTSLSSGARAAVMVHGATLQEAKAAVAETGMQQVTTFDKIGVVVATGTTAQIQAVRAEPGVTYVEGNQPIEFFSDSSNVATRGYEATQTLTGADGSKLSGKGVSVAVIDSGVDPTHPYFKQADGTSAVVANLKTVCDPFDAFCSVQKVPGSVDTDTLSLGGHGTHVSGIVAGRPTTLTSGKKLQGAAPGAKLVSLSTGAGIVIIGADAALNWVLENHEAPCGAGVAATTCPPIKVTNNSYGPTSGGKFNPESATAKLQRELAAEGVVTVWANGNGGGDGSANRSNPPGQDPTPGIVSVASYFDQDSGTRDGVLSDYSSRGDRTEAATWPDISAPGQNITSACRPQLAICSTGGRPQSGANPQDVAAFNTISGTSMAAPHIAGIVAQLFQLNPSATPGEIEDALKSTAYQYADGARYRSAGEYQSSFDKGTGLVDVVGAVNALGGHLTVTSREASSDTTSEPAATCG